MAANVLSKDDFPAPFGPMIAVSVPFDIERLMFLSRFFFDFLRLRLIDSIMFIFWIPKKN